MNVPPSLLPLVDDGIIEEVLRPLMSGKEAQVYLVVAGGQERVAKVYKDAQQRSFKHRADYTEGRRTRNSRDQRAMQRRSKHGKAQDEAAWRSTEVDMIYRLRAAGVRVPAPYIFSDGVLVMEFITDADGFAAPRLGDADLGPDAAREVFEGLLQEVIRMLCAGVVHGDLSDFNVLLGARGPVVIDFPQALDAAGNRNARNILIRDVDNLHNFMARWTRGYQRRPYAQEMWALYERGELLPDTRLRGLFRADEKRADVGGLLREIGDARRDAARAGLVRDERGEPSERSTDDDAGRGDGARGARRGADGFGGGAPGGGGPARRRIEVVVDRGGRDGGGGPRGRGDARGPGRSAPGGPRSTNGSGDGGRMQAGRPGGATAQNGQARPDARAERGAHAERGPQGERGARAEARTDATSSQRAQGRPDARSGREGRRGRPLPDTEALLAAQPVVTDAQRAKAAQIAEAARAAQAARAARGAQPPKGSRPARDTTPAHTARGGQPPKGSRPAGDGAPMHRARNAQPQKGGHAGRDAAPTHARTAAAGAGVASNGAPSSSVEAEAPAKRRRRRRRGRSGAASQEPSA